jgi:mannose-6-phosphate isomerase-like protein (cupin superfamily)
MKDPISSVPGKGMFNWGTVDRWPILRGLSASLTILAPGYGSDAVWYPDVDLLLVIAKGRAEVSILSQPVQVEPKVHFKEKRIMSAGDMAFIPRGMMFVFYNIGDSELQVVGFLPRSDPKLPVSLASFGLYDYASRQAALLQYGSKRDENSIYVDAKPSLGLLTRQGVHFLPIDEEIS